MLGRRQGSSQAERRRSSAVITWLASYPRSGITLLRTILNACFGLTSQSIYSDEEFGHPAIQAMIGHEAIGPDAHGFVEEAKRLNRSLYVKTHELPGDDCRPAIYVVRGKTGPSWSEHVNAWALSGRPNTLIVRYEDLAAGKFRTLRAISEFTRRPLLRTFKVSFEQLHALCPTFFRCGSDQANLRELDKDSMLLFERLHGDTLRKIGYEPTSYEIARQCAGTP